MTVHFFPKGNIQVASSRQRAFFVAEELKKIGVSTVMCLPYNHLLSVTAWPAKMKVIFSLVRSLFHVRKGDVVFIQRGIYSSYFLMLVYVFKRLLRRKLVFDFDDAVYLHYPKQTRLLTCITNAVLAGSHTVMEWALKYNKSVHFVPTAISFERYKESSLHHKKNKTVTIGWIGHGPHHYNNLALLVTVFTKCIEKGLKFRLKIVGVLESDKVKSLFSNIAGLPTEFVNSLDWAEHNAVPNAIHSFDIGVMPLTDSAWNYGKCAFKAIEYMACGVPVVASAIGENNYLIQDGTNGFTAATDEEWIMKLEKLINDEQLRNTIGAKGQVTVEKNYSYHITVPEIKKILEKI